MDQLSAKFYLNRSPNNVICYQVYLAASAALAPTTALKIAQLLGGLFSKGVSLNVLLEVKGSIELVPILCIGCFGISISKLYQYVLYRYLYW